MRPNPPDPIPPKIGPEYYCKLCGLSLINRTGGPYSIMGWYCVDKRCPGFDKPSEG